MTKYCCHQSNEPHIPTRQTFLSKLQINFKHFTFSICVYFLHEELKEVEQIFVGILYTVQKQQQN